MGSNGLPAGGSVLDELRDSELVDFEASLDAAGLGGVGFSFGAAPALDEALGGGGGAGGAAGGDDVSAAFTTPQEVTDEQFDAVEGLLKQARAAKKEAQSLGAERKKMEKQIRALTSLNEQLRANNKRLQEEKAEQERAQMDKLVAANARLQLSKRKDPNAQKRQEELARALEGAEGYLLEEVDAEAAQQHRVGVVERKKWWRRRAAQCVGATERCGNKMGNADLRFIEARYGQGIAVYFQFSRWLWFLNVVSMPFVLSIVLLQLLDGRDLGDGEARWLPTATEGGQEKQSTIVPLLTHVPHMLLFSAVQHGGVGPYLYSLALVLLAIFLVTMAGFKYAKEKGEQKAEEVYAAADEHKFARLAFAGWDFNLSDASAVEDAKIQASEDMQMKLKEDEVLEARLNRTKEERNALLRRRVVGIGVNCVLILCSWGGIFVVTWVTTTSELTGVLGSIHQLIPLTNVTVSVINGVLPFLTKMLVKYEQYDDMATKFKMETTRLFMGKILNVLVLMYTGANCFVGGKRLGLPGLQDQWSKYQCDVYGRSATDCPEGKQCWRCPEDELGWILFKTLILEFIASKLVALAIGRAKRALARVRNDPGKARADFETSTNVIQLLYIQAVAWLTIPYLPVVTVWQPCVMYINFKWEQRVLMWYKRKPVRTFEARKAQAFIANFFVLSLIIVMSNFYLFMSKTTCPINQCGAAADDSASPTRQEQFIGPFNGEPAQASTPIDVITPPSTNPLHYLVQVLGSPFFAYMVVLFVSMRFGLERKHRVYTTSFSQQKQLEVQEELASATTQLRKANARIEHLEKQRRRDAARQHGGAGTG